MYRILFARVLSLLLFASLGGATYGHGDADWIRKGGYKSPYWGVDCCGPEDCHRIERANVTVLGGGYRIANQFYPAAQVLTSEDDNFWGCGDPYEGYRCLFVPVGM